MDKNLKEIIASHSFRCRGIDTYGDFYKGNEDASKPHVMINVKQNGENLIYCREFHNSTGKCKFFLNYKEDLGECADCIYKS